MRIRTIKPEFWTDKKVASWDHFTRLFFIGLWSCSDDYGRGSAEPARLASELFPYDLSRECRETLARVSRALARLSEESRITLYEVGGEVYYEVTNWDKHQRVDKPGKSRIPQKNKGISVDSPESSRECRESVAKVSRLEQGTGNREQVPMEQGPQGASESPWNVAFGLELPAALQTQPCLEAVKLWLSYKAERKESYKRIGLQAALTKWANEFSPDEFPSVIDQSMAAGWKGLFKIKADLYGNHAGNGAKRPHRNDNMCVSPGLEEDLRSGEYLVFGEPSPLEKQKSQTG